mmetsp:Transcript_31399/g.50989  ORF Transcript_31399/g.50989 Transcript_31399/m.50989 type:complete len:96 (-) Transcript_31399:738-1025(-)
MLYFTLAALLSASQVATACQSAQSLIEAAEGFRSCVYTDTTGHPTICYGYNLDNYVLEIYKEKTTHGYLLLPCHSLNVSSYHCLERQGRYLKSWS